MSLLSPLRRLLSRVLFSFLLPLAIPSTLYLYLYPIFHGCAFPYPADLRAGHVHGHVSQSQSFLNTLRQHLTPSAAPDPALFRLLVLADPQLEGDSSLPDPSEELLARIRCHWEEVKLAVGGEEKEEEEEEDKERDTESEPESSESDPGSNSNSSSSSILSTERLRNTLNLNLNLLHAIYEALHDLATDDIPRSLKALRKRLDLLGNDYYLAHIYRTLHWWSRPTHVTVLGDLIGSQWVSDGEFETRGRRYWGRVFRGGERVGEDVMRMGEGGGEGEGEEELEALRAVDSPWARRIINIAGNHDIGYSGDASEARIERFEKMFGRANWDVRFRAPSLSPVSAGKEQQQEEDGDGDGTITPTLHIINLNTLTLDSPPFSSDVQSHGYEYINDVIANRLYPVEDRSTFTLLLTHLPLHKRDGICTDGPYFSFHSHDDTNGPDDNPRFFEGGLKEQNHLSDHVSANGVLQGIFGMSGDEHVDGGGRGRNGLILTGHDHTGCDVVHYVNREKSTDPDSESESESESGPEWRWDARRYSKEEAAKAASNSSSPSIREVTLRSMMGEYGGNAGLLSAWFDDSPGVMEWKYDIQMCAAGVQHIWWAVHVVDVVVAVLLLLYAVLPDAAEKSKVAKPSPQRLEKKARSVETK